MWITVVGTKVVPAVNSLRASHNPHRPDLSAMPGPVPQRPPAGCQPWYVQGPRGDPGGLAVSSVAWLGSGALQVVADVLEDLAHDRAQEEQGDDHDDRDKGQEQTVLNERLAFLVLTVEPVEKSANELKHIVRYLLSSKIGSRSVEVP